MSRDDPERYRQAEAGARAGFLGTEERHEEARPQGRWDSRAAVADLQPNHVPAVVGLEPRGRNVHPARCSRGGDRLDGIERQVQEELVHLGPIDLAGRGAAWDRKPDLDLARRRGVPTEARSALEERTGGGGLALRLALAV